MTIEPNAAINKAIHAAAIAKGYADSLVVRQHVRGQKDSIDSGDWFVLNVKRQAGDDWEVRGRRRAATDLAQLL